MYLPARPGVLRSGWAAVPYLGRHSDAACGTFASRLAAGYTFSDQETTGSDITFAAIVHLAQTVPERYLRCILGSTDMVTLKTADGDFQVVDGRVTASNAPGLGITPPLDVFGDPVASCS